MSATTFPERIIVDLLNLGITAISADTDLLDDILGALSAGELTKAKDYWGDHPPSVVTGYARFNNPFPIVAVVLSSDPNLQDYIGLGEEAALDGDDNVEGFLFKRRMKGVYTVYVYADHPDVTLWYYRIVRRILNVGVKYMIANGFEDPSFDGADLAPDPRYTPDNVFVRRLTVSGEYEEEWDDTDALYTAINGANEAFLTSDGTLSVLHEDQSEDAEEGVHPILESDIES